MTSPRMQAIGREDRDGIAVFTFDHAGGLASGDCDFALALRDAVRDAGDDDEVKAIVLRARAADFCPAPQVHRVLPSAVLRPEAWERWRAAFAAATGVYQNLCYCKKVVIAAVQGECAGAGSMLTLCADLAVAGADTRFASPFDEPEANFPLTALTIRLNRTKAWALRGHVLPADEALEVGLVNRVVPADGVLDEALRMARAVTRMPLDGISMSKLNREAHLDACGVGREFDAVPFYAQWVAGGQA